MLKNHLIRGIRFGLTGLANTAIHSVVALLCLNGFFTTYQWLLFGPVAANVAGFAMATSFSYVVNTLWSFSTSISRKNFKRFIVVSVAGLMSTIVLTWVAEYIGAPPFGTVIFVVCLMPFVNFMLLNFWAYK